MNVCHLNQCPLCSRQFDASNFRFWPPADGSPVLPVLKTHGSLSSPSAIGQENAAGTLCKAGDYSCSAVLRRKTL